MAKILDSFESWDDMINHLRTVKPAWDERNCSSINRADKWSGNVTFDQAMNLAEFGWPEGRDHMSEISLDMTPENIEVTEIETVSVDVAGAYPIVPLALAGDPCHMVDIQAQEVASKIIKAVVSCSQAARIDPETLTANGAAMASYIDALEAAGWRCEVWARADSKAGSNLYSFEVCVKRAQDHLDIDRIAFALAHPAMLRKLIFRGLETHRKFQDSHKANYGAAATTKEQAGNAQLFLSSLTSNLDKNQAMNRVRDCLDQSLVA